MTRVDQSKATVHHGDMVGGNKVNVDIRRQSPALKIEALKTKLIEEMKRDAATSQIIEELQRFQRRRPSSDGIVGLEAKLTAGGRAFEIMDALEQKEMFAKLLTRWSHYVSAQEILVHLLSRAVQEFRSFIQPNIDNLDIISYNAIVSERIVKPLVDEIGDGVISFDDLISMGMYYWLAEQCFVRWHQ